jgi:hypothetical protein
VSTAEPDLIVFTGTEAYTRANRAVIRGLASVLEIRLRELLREALGGTYDVSVSGSASRIPRAEYAFNIGFSSAPERADELVRTVFAAIDTLRANGPAERDLQKVVEAEAGTTNSARQNGYWLGQIAMSRRPATGGLAVIRGATARCSRTTSCARRHGGFSTPLHSSELFLRSAMMGVTAYRRNGVAIAVVLLTSHVSRLTGQDSRIDSLFAGWNRTDGPGCIAGVKRSGNTLHLKAYGMANLEYGVPLSPESVSESGSVAKQFTSAVMVLLAKQGKLALDDDIRKHLAEVPDFGRTITIRNLLTHTSGLRDQWALLALTGWPPGTQVHSIPLILDLVSRQRMLNFEPGSLYLYSNTGYARRPSCSVSPGSRLRNGARTTCSSRSA